MSGDIGIGKLITGSSFRDAIHVAVAPVKAAQGERLQPGQRVRFLDGSSDTVVAASAKESIGIVDPFLTQPTIQGEQFYLFLPPGSITSLRHDWTHPAFGATDIKAASTAWLETFAKSIDRDLKALIEIGTEALVSGSAWVGNDDTQDRFNEVKAEFLHHISVVTGIPMKDGAVEDTYFSCSC